jgi:hypothetical protein
LSCGAGERVLLRFTCEIGRVGMEEERLIEALFRAQVKLPTAKLCARPADKAWQLSAVAGVPLDAQDTQVEEVASALERAGVLAQGSSEVLAEAGAGLDGLAGAVDGDALGFGETA